MAKIHRHVFENPGDRHQVFQGSREIVLTMKEFQILVLLAQNKGRIFSKEQIYNVVWQELYSGDCNIVMSHIHNIREKIEVNPSEPVYILLFVSLSEPKSSVFLQIK